MVAAHSGGRLGGGRVKNLTRSRRDAEFGKDLQMGELAGLPRDIVFLLIGCAVSGAGFYATIWAFRKSRKEKCPVCTLRSRRVLEAESHSWEGLDIRANGSAVKNLTLTKLALWNAGKDPIRKEDVPEPITIRLNGVSDMVSCKSLNLGRTSNNVKIEPSQTCGPEILEVRFDYLDYHDGLAVMVAHTGRGNEDIGIEGKIVGGHKLRRLDVLDAAPGFWETIRTPRYLAPVAVPGLYGAVIMGLPIIDNRLSDWLFKQDLGEAYFLGLGILGTFAVMSLTILFTIWCGLPSGGIPKELKIAISDRF